MRYHWPISGLPLVMGDANHDQGVDFGDFAELQLCFTGEVQTDVPACCRVFDFEPNNFVDLDDFAFFQAAFSGPE